MVVQPGISVAERDSRYTVVSRWPEQCEHLRCQATSPRGVRAPNAMRALVRGIDEYDVPSPLRLAAKPGQRGHVVDFACGMQTYRLCAQCGCRPLVVFDERRGFSTPRQCFEGECAGSSEQVQDAGTVDLGVQPVEYGFANPVHGGPQ